MFLIRKTKGTSRIVNAQLLRRRIATQVLSIYQLSNKVAYRLWQYIKGYVYTSDGKAVKFSDGRYMKFKDQ